MSQAISMPSTSQAAAAGAAPSTALTVTTSPGAAPAAASAQQAAALRQLMAKYKYDLGHGVAPATLANLGRQIMTAAHALGQHVTLPHVPAQASSELPTATAGGSGSGVNVTA